MEYEDSKASWRGDRSKKFGAKRAKKVYGRQSCNCERCQQNRTHCDCRDRTEAERQIEDERYKNDE